MTFEEFVHAEMGGLARFAGALTGNRHLAEDVLSDALLAVSARWPRVRAMESPAGYARQVVISTYLSDQRKARRRRTHPTDDTVLLDRATPDLSDAIVQRDEVARLLVRLTPKQRIAVVLRYLHDQTDAEIAQALDCTPGSVRAHLSLARATLRLGHDTSVERS